MNILKRFIDKKLQKEINVKEQLLKDALIYLEYDLKHADDIVEYSALNDIIYDIEENLKISKNNRITKERFA